MDSSIRPEKEDYVSELIYEKNKILFLDVGGWKSTGKASSISFELQGI